MGQYFKAYSPARKSVANISYSQNFNLDWLRNVPDYSPEKIGKMFDEIESKMGAEFGEYCLVGDYETIVYRTGEVENPNHFVEKDKHGFTDIVWFGGV